MIKTKKYAFVIIHFGSNIKYFEYELYTILMLNDIMKDNKNIDTIYLYSINDTPKYYVDIMKELFTKCISYDDDKITYNITYDSFYKHFNTIRTCNVMFAFKLINYKKICIIESDMVIMSDIKDVFNLKTPAIHIYENSKKCNKQYIRNITDELSYCSEKSPVNGGVLVLTPSLKAFEFMKNNLKKIISLNCRYPNESLLLLYYKQINNLPIIYNYTHYDLNKKLNDKPIKIVHFNETTYKPLDIIRNNYKNKFEVKRKIVEYYKINVYEKYRDIIDKILLEFN
jgi:hypothetical protein